MDDTQGTFEDRIQHAADYFAEQIDEIATRTYVREGILKQAVVAAIWALFEKMPDERGALADILEDFPAIIRDTAANARRAEDD